MHGTMNIKFKLFHIVSCKISIIYPLPELRPTEVTIKISLRQFQFKVGPTTKMSLHVNFELFFSISLTKLCSYYFAAERPLIWLTLDPLKDAKSASFRIFDSRPIRLTTQDIQNGPCSQVGEEPPVTITTIIIITYRSDVSWTLPSHKTSTLLLKVFRQARNKSICTIRDRLSFVPRIHNALFKGHRNKQFWESSELLTVVTMRPTVFWNVTPCSLAEIHRSIGNTYCTNTHRRSSSVWLLAGSYDTLTSYLCA